MTFCSPAIVTGQWRLLFNQSGEITFVEDNHLAVMLLLVIIPMCGVYLWHVHEVGGF